MCNSPYSVCNPLTGRATAPTQCVTLLLGVQRPLLSVQPLHQVCNDPYSVCNSPYSVCNPLSGCATCASPTPATQPSLDRPQEGGETEARRHSRSLKHVVLCHGAMVPGAVPSPGSFTRPEKAPPWDGAEGFLPADLPGNTGARAEGERRAPVPGWEGVGKR